MFYYICAIAIVLALLYWLSLLQKYKNLSKKLPTRIGLPFVGVLAEIRSMKNVLPWLQQSFETSRSDTVFTWFGMTPYIMSRDVEFSKTVLNSKDFLEKGVIYKPLIWTFKKGLLITPVERWLVIRKLLNPVFGLKPVQSLFPIFNRVMYSTIETFGDLVEKGPQNVLHIFMELLVQLSIESTLNKEPLKADVKKVTNNFIYLFDMVNLQMFANFFGLGRLPMLSPKFQRSMKQIRENAFKDVINNKSGSPALLKDNIFHTGIFETLTENGYTLPDIIQELNTIFVAAFEPLSNAIYSVLVLLAMHPQHQQALFDELLDRFPDKQFEMSYEILEHMPYLDMVCKESLRLVPVAPIIVRQTVAETALDEQLILPKNTQVLISIYHLHRSEKIWGSTVNQYDPNRFMPANINEVQQNAFMPFSRGSRSCIGSRFAEYALKTITAGLVRNFRFETTFKFEDLRFIEQITIRYEIEPKLSIFSR